MSRPPTYPLLQKIVLACAPELDLPRKYIMDYIESVPSIQPLNALPIKSQIC